MKLTDADKKFLRSIGYRKKDFDQIEIATSLTKYSVNNKLVCDEVAAEMLGREAYLVGIGRSAFHWSTVQEADDGRLVYFDSSALFREDGD